MDLKRYLKINKISAIEFSRKIGAPSSSVYRLISDPWRIPRSDLALAVIRGSGGLVTLEDLVHYSRRKRLPRVPRETPEQAPPGDLGHLGDQDPGVRMVAP